MKFVLDRLAWISHLPRWSEGVLYVLLAWFGIGLVWFVLSPVVGLGNLAMPAATQTSKQDFSPLRGWFETASSPAQATKPVDGLNLIAVIAGYRGVALLGGVEASAVAVKVGTEFRPGSKLVEVLPDRVVIEQGGQRRELALPVSASAPAMAMTASITPVTTTAVTAPAQPPMLLSRGQFSSAIQGGNLGKWDKGLASASEGGILVEEAGIQPLGKFLKLEDGDVMKRVNDRPLAQLADISLVYNAFSQRDSVELTILRNNTTQTLRYQIRP